MRCQKDRGQATVEVALVLPVLVVVVGLAIWVGQVMTTQLQLEHAAREGARAAAVDPDNAWGEARRAVETVDAEIGVDVSLGSEWVEVTVTRDMSGVPLLGAGARKLTADVTMRREDQIEP